MGLFIMMIVYVMMSLLVAFLGKNRKFGFWGFFFCSLLFTPIAGMLAYFASCEKVHIIIKEREDKKA